MKSQLFTLILTVFLGSAYGQKGTLLCGAEGGLNLSSLRGHDFIDDNNKSKTGSIFGVYGSYNFSRVISLRTGVYTEKKSSSFDFIATDANGMIIGNIEVEETFDYMTFPLLLRATFGNKLNYFINTGPYYAILLRQIQSTDAFKGQPGTENEYTDDFQKEEFGISAGIGLNYNLSIPLGFSFEIRDNYGLSDISKTPVFSNGETKTNSLTFLLGLYYRFHEREK